MAWRISKIAAAAWGFVRWAVENVDARDIHAYGGLGASAAGVYWLPSNLSTGGALLTVGLGLFYLAVRRVP